MITFTIIVIIFLLTFFLLEPIKNIKFKKSAKEAIMHNCKIKVVINEVKVNLYNHRNIILSTDNGDKFCFEPKNFIGNMYVYDLEQGIKSNLYMIKENLPTGSYLQVNTELQYGWVSALPPEECN